MKIIRVAIIVIAVTVLMSTEVSAQQVTKASTEQSIKQQEENKVNIDPIKSLEDKKAELQKRLAEGKITKEEADQKTAKINEIILKIQDFNKLSLQQKRDKLISEFTMHMNKKVQEGRLNQNEANTKIASFKEKINNWDGNGYPMFHEKGKHHSGDMKEKIKNTLSAAVKDGKITQKQADALMEYFK